MTMNRINKLNSLTSKIAHATRIPPSQIIVTKADSGATNHYIRECDASVLENVRLFNGPTVQLLNDATLQSKVQGELTIPNISPTGQNSHVLPGAAAFFALPEFPKSDERENFVSSVDMFSLVLLVVLEVVVAFFDTEIPAKADRALGVNEKA